jgi:hypothetical protein
MKKSVDTGEVDFDIKHCPINSTDICSDGFVPYVWVFNATAAVRSVDVGDGYSVLIFNSDGHPIVCTL